MRRLYTILAASLLTVSLFAQSPEKMSYQAVIRNSSNALVASQSVGMKISILQGSAIGTAVYLETQTATTNANGLVNIEIGGGTAVIGSFSAIDWTNGSYFIKTEIDPAGGTNYNITGTSQLLSVPYALYAKTAGTTNSTSGHYIGEHYGGGIVFFVYDNGQHGLIAASADYSSAIKWYNATNTTTNAVRDGIGAGKINTERIIINQGQASYAAQVCAIYNIFNDGGNFGDWYLPSKYELNLLYSEKSIVGGFSNSFYWSSTEYGINGAFCQNFNNGTQDYNWKYSTYQVRAIRAF